MCRPLGSFDGRLRLRLTPVGSVRPLGSLRCAAPGARRFMRGGRFVSASAAADSVKKVGAEQLAAAAQAYKELQQQGRLMEVIILGLLIVILILIGGRLALAVAGVAMAKASSAEELAAAPQAFNEAQQEGRLME